jgi:hypothetical protein
MKGKTNMLELEIKNLTAAITRLADLMEAGAASTENWDGPVVEQAPAVTPAPAPVDLVAMRQQAQDTCLETVRANRENKTTIATWLAEHDAKTIKQLDDCFLDGFINFLEGLAK